MKNYTSNVPVERTVARIEAVLAKAGARSVQKDYKDGELVALSFVVQLPDHKPVNVRLPVNAEAVFQAMRRNMKRPRAGSLQKLVEQSLRTSWKLMQDWVEVQLSLIEMQQADFLQVFLPYVYDGEQTFYQRLKAGNFKALPAPREEA
jgi:hypothetical protein